jgi:hydrophobe/amphiphile efflux-1 (HAE1) family protein
VELGGKDYNYSTRFRGGAGVLIAVSLAPGANAMETAELVRAELASLKSAFPAGLDYKIMYDTSDFVSASIEEVVRTFFEALILVLIVVFLFLQSWRATLIPMLAVPVSLVATFSAYVALDFSINTLSLFGMVLAIGIVVDDAIVVVEAVEQNMHAHKLSPLEATRKAMDEVQGPVLAIALVLSAVFIPMGFIPGVTGQLYKQFAVTIAVATMLSALVALTLTPALCAMILRPRDHGHDAAPRGPVQRFFQAFNAAFDRLNQHYGRVTTQGARRLALVVTVLAVVVVSILGLLRVTPTGFVPDEDKGSLFMQIILPDAASQQRTDAVLEEVEKIVVAQAGVEAMTGVAGYDLISGTVASNCALIVVRLKPWEERGPDQHALRVLGELTMKTRQIPGAVVVAFNPPALPGFGAISGFTAMLEARGNQSPEELAQVTQQFIAAAQQDPAIGRVTTTYSATTPNYRLAVDREKVKKLGVPVNDLFATLQMFMGGYQVNEFSNFGRNYKVTIQADTEFRTAVRDISKLFVRNAQGDMVPLDAVTTPAPSTGARFMQRYNLYRTAALSGVPAPGASSGDAIAAIERAAATTLPPDYAVEWTGQSLQEKAAGNTATLVMALSIVVVFLFLAALYESWSVPLAVLMATPFGFMGALLALKLGGIAFNVYGQVGLVTLIGLSAKNAILIVEFAKLNREAGKPLVEAAIEAAQLRLRPILMTSFAFILGVVPLAIATGAGAASKHSVGIAVFGGMIAATLLTSLTVPAFYVLIQGLSERFGKAPSKQDPAAAGAGA